MLPQSSWIAAFLGVGFVVFITARGELASYLGIVFGSAPSNLQVSGFSVPLQSSPLPNVQIPLNQPQNTSAALTPLTTQQSSVTDTIPLEDIEGFNF